MSKKALAQKILMLGLDGMDPRFTMRMLKKGKMPNVQKILDRGASSENLIMLGSHPTITPPMWTTLSTGCNPNVHGITQFSLKGSTIGGQKYSLTSSYCKAEPLWNVFAEAGKKTLVWHWPGCSWPPTSDSENLFVVDGTSPGGVGAAACKCDKAFIVGGNPEFKEVTFLEKSASEAAAACIIDRKEVETKSEFTEVALAEGADMERVILREGQKSTFYADVPLDMVKTPIKDATGWAVVSEDAKEFTILYSKGMIRRPALILKDENGNYSRVQIFKSKKDIAPVADLQEVNKMYTAIIDEAAFDDGRKVEVARNMKIVKLNEDASQLILYVSEALETKNDSVWSPKRMHKSVMENVGPIPPSSAFGNQNAELIRCMIEDWDSNAKWQAAAIQHVIKKEGIEVLFSHFHGIDLQTHMILKHMNEKEDNTRPVADVIQECEDIYVQADNYIGEFVHMLDEGWTILVFSDHGLVSSEYDQPFIGDTNGVNYRVMHDLGFTNVLLDEKGNETDKIDWATTKAVALGENHIWLNLKGREPYGIVDPKDQYELERQIIDGLYNYRDPKTGRRIVSVAVRNRDAIHFGLGGPDSGDIIYFNEEGFNFDHGDCLSTTYGAEDTSVSPIFLAAGPGIKENYTTKRIIREVDFAATVAVLGGVRMPHECEGAPAYQILAE